MDQSTAATAAFYDSLAATYDQLYPHWDGAVREQGDALDAVLGDVLGPGAHRILDVAAGIGTQLIGLALHGHEVVGTDLSSGAVGRAGVECRRRGLAARLAVADMRRLPVADGSFDVTLCADNALAHLLTRAEVGAALAEMGRATRPAGAVVVSVRDYDEARRDRRAGTLPQVSRAGVAFQVWTWHPDGARYDLEHFTLARESGGWAVQVRRSTMWAMTQDDLVACAHDAGLVDLRWITPDESGFFQPLLLARVPG